MDVRGNLIRVLGAPDLEGDSPGKLNAPHDVCLLFESDQRVLAVVDRKKTRICIMTTDGRFVHEYRTSSEVSRCHPVAVCADAVTNDVYVAIYDPIEDTYKTVLLGWRCAERERVTDLLAALVGRDPSGRVFDYISSLTEIHTLFPDRGPVNVEAPNGLAIARGELYICDEVHICIHAVSLTDTRHRVWGTLGGSDGEFKSPHSVAVSAEGEEVFILDRGNNRIQVFSRDGHFIRKFGSVGWNDGELLQPHGLVLNGDEVLVADSGNHRISAFDSVTGRFLRHIIVLPTFQTPSSVDVLQPFPQGMALDPVAGELYITDSKFHCIYVVQ